MKQTLLTAFLLAGIAVPVIAEEATTAPATEQPEVTISIDTDAPASDAATEDEHGLTISINGDEEDSAKEKEIEDRIEKKVESLVEGFFRRSDDKLSDEDKKQLIRDLKELKELDSDFPMTGDKVGDVAMGGIFLGGLAIIFIFGTPIFIVAGILYASYRKRRLIHDTINGYVASGKDIPPEVFASFQQETGPKTPRTNLHKGLVMVGIGAGIIACFMVLDSDVAAIGAIPLFIGLAQLLIWKLESNGNGSKGGN